ncbi:unnamed protein product [Moneuplotes crassus]|uniref:Uncharacterized protein n=1 Tax=Euplotes crassus TaxID=5936 RepID=A0AAD1XV66_EUPCR|nr:unnamed protein product [Moneuplotes crassus]
MEKQDEDPSSLEDKKELDEESKDQVDDPKECPPASSEKPDSEESPKIITREDKKKMSGAKKRGFYKRCLKRSSATDDIDSLTVVKQETKSTDD